jgi:hypothetical protein
LEQQVAHLLSPAVVVFLLNQAAQDQLLLQDQDQADQTVSKLFPNCYIFMAERVAEVQVLRPV